MNELKPFFQQFHAYVRGQLRKKYSEDLIKRHQPYPQHLAEIYLGNAFRLGEPGWFMDVPYNMAVMPNLTESLLKRGLINAEVNFWNAKEYFESLGMPLIEK